MLVPPRKRVSALAGNRISADRVCARGARQTLHVRSPVGPETTLLVQAAEAIGSASVDENDVSRWFGGYLNVVEACGRGENDARSLLAYYGVPLLVATDDGFIALAAEDQVVAVAQP